MLINLPSKLFKIKFSALTIHLRQKSFKNISDKMILRFQRMRKNYIAQIFSQK